MNFLKYAIEEFKMNVKENMEYRFSSIVFIFLQTILSWISLIVTYSIYELTNQGIPGWSFYEIIFMISLNNIIIGIYNLTFKLRKINHWIRRGRLDNILVRPMHPLLQTLHLDYYHGGMLLSGLFMLLFAAPQISLALKPLNLLLFIASMILGYISLFSIELIVYTISFFTTKIHSIEYNTQRLRTDFSKWPMSIYPDKLQIILTLFFAIPFFGFIPASLMLEKQLAPLFLLSPVSALILLVIALKFFDYGLKNYSGTGS